MKSYISLSKKQIVLYQSLVKDLENAIKNSPDDVQKRGIILGSLIKFKQLCNHPEQYLGIGSYKELDSGKFIRLKEICETIHEKREKVLVFTQFKEIIEPIRKFMKEIFGHNGQIIHGSMTAKKRKQSVELFQGGKEHVPFMILSIKAGGVGLNLTEANHVIHFDRWWNPAVENQATDRAFRIGQKNNVIVHKFITKGTIEEKIDEMITDKLKLSTSIIKQSGENWITKMEDKELINMFRLRL